MEGGQLLSQSTPSGRGVEAAGDKGMGSGQRVWWEKIRGKGAETRVNGRSKEKRARSEEELPTRSNGWPLGVCV